MAIGMIRLMFSASLLLPAIFWSISYSHRLHIGLAVGDTEFRLLSANGSLQFMRYYFWDESQTQIILQMWYWQIMSLELLIMIALWAYLHRKSKRKRESRGFDVITDHTKRQKL
jgi:hypothetical protein